MKIFQRPQCAILPKGRWTQEPSAAQKTTSITSGASNATTSSGCPHPNFNVMIKKTLHDALPFTTPANKTQVVHVSFVFKKPLASSRQLSCFRQLWYGWGNPRCRWHHHDFCFSTSVLDIYVQKLRMTQLTQSDWPILLQRWIRGSVQVHPSRKAGWSFQ